MEVPVEVDLQDVGPAAHVHESIVAHVAALEKRFGRIVACRVAVKGPTGRHRTGGAYLINIHLLLPDGRAVDIDRLATDDERFADPDFAVNDAFKRARRRLQDQVRRMQGHVKTHAAQPSGTVTRLDKAGGFGFLETAEGREVFFHRNSVLNDGFGALKVGARVVYSEEEGDKGPLAGKHALR